MKSDQNMTPARYIGLEIHKEKSCVAIAESQTAVLQRVSTNHHAREYSSKTLFIDPCFWGLPVGDHRLPGDRDETVGAGRFALGNRHSKIINHQSIFWFLSSRLRRGVVDRLTIDDC